MNSPAINILTNSILKLNNLFKSKTTPLDVHLSINNLPDKYNVDMAYCLLKKSRQEGNNILLEDLNPYKFENEVFIKKTADVYYVKEKLNNLTNTDTVTKVAEKMTNKTNCICNLNVDIIKSSFANDIVYENKSLIKTIEVINTHPCKVTRLFNGKMNIEILTSKPINQHNFVYISNTNLIGKPIPQFKSLVGIQIDENMVTEMEVLNFSNIELKNYILNNNQLSHCISEESFFHYENKTQYSIEYYESIEYSIMQNYDNFNKLLDGLLILN